MSEVSAETIARLGSEDDDERKRAREQITAHGTEAALEAFGRALEHESEAVRKAGWEGLRGYGSTAVKQLCEAIRSDHEDTRRIGIQAADRYGSRAWPHLKVVLTDERAEVRLVVIETLAKAGSDEVVPWLIERAKTDDDSGVRCAATVALGTLAPDAVREITQIAVLLEELQEDPDPAVVAAVDEAIARIKARRPFMLPSQERRRRRFAKIGFAVVMTPIVLVAVAPILAKIIQTFEPVVAGLVTAGLAAGAAVVTTAFLFIIWRCPSCKRRWARETLNVSQIGTRTAYRTVTDTSGVNRNIQTLEPIYRYDYRCTKCGHRWSG